MLDKKHRLTDRILLEKVKNEGTLYQSESFGLLVRNQETKGPSRFSFVVSTKVAKNAVERNRARRILREVVRSEKGHLKKGYDAIFLLKKKALNKKADNLRSEVKKVFKESGIIK